MHRKHQLFPWLMAAGLLAGCASSQMSRIDRNRGIYETWPIEVRQAVLDGKVEPGMTPEMVEVSWGKPSEIVAGAGGNDEIWVYKTGGSDGTVYYPGGGVGTMGGMGGTGSGIGISTGSGGTSIGTSAGIGMGSSGIGMGGSGIGMGTGGMGSPVVIPSRPPDIKEVVFRNGVVHRADAPK